MSEVNGRTHDYHAEATVLQGHLRLPLVQEIKPQAFAKLPETGGYLSQRAEDYRLESVISFHSAYTQVAGNLDVKPGHGWTTLTTTVVEGLNVLDVLTADRVVGQVLTEHPLVGYVPSISFLGSRFENLRIAGHPVDLDLDLDILGGKPEDDAAYTRNQALKERIAGQEEPLGEHQGLLAELREGYNRLFPCVEDGGEKPETLECSLVNRADGGYPGRSSGHIIDVPNFGKIILARLSLQQKNFNQKTGVPETTSLRLTMIDLVLGCPIAGNTGVGVLSTNGANKP